MFIFVTFVYPKLSSRSDYFSPFQSKYLNIKNASQPLSPSVCSVLCPARLSCEGQAVIEAWGGKSSVDNFIDSVSRYSVLAE